MKLVDIKKADNDDLIPRLEALLNYAKENRLNDFACVYYLDDEASFTHSYRTKNKIRLIGHLVVLIEWLLRSIDIE